MIIDLVTLESCKHGGEEIPAGATLLLGLRYLPQHPGQRELDEAIGKWESDCTALLVEASHAETGLRYKFSSGEDELILLVEERPDLA